ncbi:DNA-binding transcriptional regulator, Lrp family [Filimonas lacunae]|uniref:DNA-binding transcriptional regulator, Lrp family n=1 Tax=Filimonas lacunae TaxID=477680 RepID=A0A173ME44_9BACT|nr:Lrp/AsnC family transcriptional regulator [Filimonas lacunae]BAV05766.1 leucine-responsive regulatory protein, regulator for leucine (or lrp) regulon and high-affinity branched-chain amino acid transport system [Filimonas lacunae]SIT28684.1 DNA-binding transcriptional regulator, Lrp family [Filimonas lacunae]
MAAKDSEKEEIAVQLPALDTKDLAILKLLQQNARITVREISEQVHLSTTPVHERIRRMEETGVIKQYATLVDHAKVKKGLMVICYVSLKQHNRSAGSKFIKAIQEMQEVIECYNISGEFDFMLKVVAENMDAYYNFHVNKLSQVENMGHLQSVFVMGIIKQTHQLVY